MSALVDGTLFEVPEHWWKFKRCSVCGGALSVTHSHTYAVQRQGWVKIGATSNPRRRFNELARPAWTQHILSPDGMDWHEPLVLLALLDFDVEHDLHRGFSAAHVFGEWFLPDAGMRAWLGVYSQIGVTL